MKHDCEVVKCLAVFFGLGGHYDIMIGQGQAEEGGRLEYGRWRQ